MGSATPLTFRVATTSDDDVDALLKLVRSAYRGEDSRKGWTTEADLLADERIDHDGIRAKIQEPHGVILMAHDDEGEEGEGAKGRLAACCELLRRDEHVSYFGMFAVDPNRQAGGIGRRVLAEAEAYARKEFGVARMEMTVIWTREELISWYVRRGYTRTDERRPFPYEHLVNGKALRDDLYFICLYKDL